MITPGKGKEAKAKDQLVRYGWPCLLLYTLELHCARELSLQAAHSNGRVKKHYNIQLK